MPKNIRFGNPLQSNPSGINALALHGKIIGDYFIQTLICPVRYADFDEFKNGKGIIETFIQPFIKDVDMIITVSQGGSFRFDVDRFPCKNRGGFMDNMFWGKSKDGFDDTYFKQLANGKEFYETTLPYQKIVPTKNNYLANFKIYFNQTFVAQEKKYTNNKTEGLELIEYQDGYYDKSKCIITGIEEIQKYTSIKGSGSNYLSNEIFYRVAKIRTESGKSTLLTGHLHIPLTQNKGIIDEYNIANQEEKIWFKEEYHNVEKITLDINPIIVELINEIKLIIKKI